MRSSLQRVVAGFLDRRERGSRLLGMLVEEVQGDAGLDVDQRDVVGEHVVQLLRETQPLLARRPLPCFTGQALLLGPLLLAHPHDLGHGEHEQKPSGDEHEVEPAQAVGGTRVDRLRDEKRHVPEAREHPRRLSSQLHPVVEGHDDAEEDRPIRIAVRDVDGGRGGRRDDGRQGEAVAHGEGGRSDQQQDDGEHVETVAIRLVVRGADRADDLEHSDPERGEQHRGVRGRLHACHGRAGPLPTRHPLDVPRAALSGVRAG